MAKPILSFFALAALTCLPALAQSGSLFFCAASADTPLLRVGGRAELLGEFRVDCSGVSASVTVADINLSLSSDFSGRITNTSTNLTEALLIVGDPLTPSIGTNTYQGTLQSPNTLRFSGVRLQVPSSGRIGFRIVNLRADAGEFYIPNLANPNALLGFISSTVIPFNNPQQVLGYVALGQRFQVTNSNGDPLTTLSFAGAGTRSLALRFDEGFPAAFRKRNLATSVANPAALSAQAAYGTYYGTESGFYLPSLNLGDAGLATQGTRVFASFSNLPPGVSLAVSAQQTAGSSGSIQARLISTNPDGSGPYAAVTPNSDGTAPLTITGGAARAVWEVLSSDPAVLENLQFTLVATSTSSSNGAAGMTAGFGPSNGQSIASTASPAPRFISPNLQYPERQCGVNCLTIPVSLSFDYTIGSTAPPSVTFPVRSTGSPLPFQAAVTSGGSLPYNSVAPSDSPWLTLSAASGVTPAFLTLTANPAGLVPGKYPAQVTITSGGFSERIFVLLDVKSTVAATPVPGCYSGGVVPPAVRSTGIAERTADIVLICDGILPNTVTDIRLSLSTTITSRPSDILLLVNEPSPVSQAIGTNVFYAERVTDTEVRFRNVAVPPGGSTILRIVNLHADASRVGLSPISSVPSAISAAVRLSSLPNVTPQATVAYVLPAHTFRLLNTAGTEVSSLAAAGNGKLRFQEAQTFAFRRRNIGTTPSTPSNLVAQNNPGAIYNTETGFYNPALPPGTGIDMGLATQGTRLVARITNVPAGVTVAVSVNELGAATPRTQLVQTDSNGAGAFQSIAGPYAPVTLTNGSGIAVWEVLTNDSFNPLTLDFGLQVTGTMPSSSAVEGLLGPLSIVTTANASAPLPRFATANSDNPVCLAFPCLKLPASITLTSNGISFASAVVDIVSDTNPLPYTVDNPAVPWLSLQVAAGVTPGQLTVSANPAGLAAGTYSTILYVGGIAIPVTFNVLAAGPTALLLAREREDFAFTVGSSPASRSISVSGTPGLSWQAAVNVPWLLLSTQTGITSSAPMLSILGSTLPAGEYDGVVTFTASGAAPVYLKVRASVTPASGGYSITGTITPPRAGVTVTLTGAENRTATTAANGTYSITGLTAGGPYTVTPTFSGLTFSPASRNYTTVPSTQIADFNSASFGAPPQLISSTPATPFGSPHTFQIRVSDADGAANIGRVFFLVSDSANAVPGTCHGFFDRAANAFFLLNDALNTTLGPAAPGAATTLQNSQCQLLGATSTAGVQSGAELSFNLSLALKSPFADSPRNFYLWVQDNDGNGTGWLSSARWLPLGANPPFVTSASLVANTETALFRPADPDNNLARAFFVVNSTPAVQINGCHGFYDYAANAFFLYNDSLTAFVEENSSCAINRAGSFRDSSGQLQLSLTRKGVLSATKIYLWITDATNLGTGWLDLGLNLPSRANLPPTISNGTPANANSLSQAFSASIADPTGIPDLTRIYFLVNPNANIPQNTCHGFYERSTGLTYLYNDALTAASSSTLENSQCRIQSVTATPGPTSLTLAFTVTRKGAYTSATQNIYLWALDAGGNGTGWVQVSTWSNGGNTPPTVIATNPANLSGPIINISMTARDLDGANDLARLYFLFNPDANIPQATCHGFYDRAANALFLYNDTLSALLGPVTPGSFQVIENSQCAVAVGSTQVTSSGTDIVFNLSLSIKTGVAANAYLWAVDKQNAGTGWVLTASWTPPAGNIPPSIVNRQDGFSGATANVTFVASDPNGYADIQRLYFQISSDLNSAQSSCVGYYDKAANGLFLFNDFVTAVTPDGQNSQCRIEPSSLRVSTSTDSKDLILNFNISLKAPFANTTRNVYLSANDTAGAGSNFAQTGQWRVNQNLSPTVSPASPSALFNAGVANPIGFPVADGDGNGNIARIYFLIADSPTVTANSCHGYFDRANGGLFLYNDSLTTLLGPGVSQNSQCRVTGNGTLARSSLSNLSLTFPIEILSGSYLATPKKIYIWVVDQQNNGTGWVQVATWN